MLSLVSLWVSGTYSGHAAGETFNSRLLELEHPVDIDISQFSRPDNLPEGDYQVDIYINERFFERREIHFFRTNNESALQPCFRDLKNTLAIGVENRNWILWI